jgi:hypothetical protein
MSTGTAQTVVSPRSRRRLGVWSFWIALCTLVFTVAMAVIYLRPFAQMYFEVENVSLDGFARSLAGAVLPLWLKIAGPLLHAASLVMGFAGLIRRGDSRLLGFLGIVLDLAGFWLIAVLFAIAMG